MKEKDERKPMQRLSLNSVDLNPVFTRSRKSPLPSRSYSGPGWSLLSYSGMAFRICQRYTLRRKDAQHMVFEIFAKIVHASDGRRGINPLNRVYLATIDHCIRALRYQKSKEGLDLEHLDVDSLGILRTHCCKVKAKIALERILEKVRPTTRKILFLSHLEGLPPEEIASILDRPLLSVLNKLCLFEKEMEQLESSSRRAWKFFLSRYY